MMEITYLWKPELKRNYRWLYILFTAVIFFYNIRNISNLTAPSILLDEFGYWATGATFLGKNWSGIASAFCPYYAYGYGMLLALVMRFTGNMSVAYQTAIFLNAIMVCVCFLLYCVIFKKIFKDMEQLYIILGSFLIQFLPNVIYQTQSAWTEIFLMFIFAFIVFVLQKMLESPTPLTISVFSILLIYLYMVHQRNLGILFTGLLVILLLKYTDRISTKQLILFCLVSSIMFFLHILLKDFVNSRLWYNYELNTYVDSLQENSRVNINNFEGQIVKIKLFFSQRGLELFLISFFGKVFYMGISSLFLGFEGLQYLFIGLKKFFLLILRKSESIIQDNDFLNLFLLGAYITTLIISSIATITPGRIDTVLYGRYTDWLLGAIILYGFLNIFRDDALRKRFSFYSVFISSYTIFLWDYMNKYDISTLFDSCAPIARFFARLTPGNRNWVMLMSCLTFIAVFLIFFFIKNENKFRDYVLITCSALVIWCVITGPAIENTAQITKAKEWEQMAKCIIEIRKDNEPVYYVHDVPDAGWGNIYIGSVQFFLDEIPVRCISSSRIKELDGPAIIILPVQYDMKQSSLTEYGYILEQDVFNVISLE